MAGGDDEKILAESTIISVSYEMTHTYLPCVFVFHPRHCTSLRVCIIACVYSSLLMATLYKTNAMNANKRLPKYIIAILPKTDSARLCSRLISASHLHDGFIDRQERHNDTRNGASCNQSCRKQISFSQVLFFFKSAFAFFFSFLSTTPRMAPPIKIGNVVDKGRYIPMAKLNALMPQSSITNAMDTPTITNCQSRLNDKIPLIRVAINVACGAEYVSVPMACSIPCDNHVRLLAYPVFSRSCQWPGRIRWRQ